ncbi:hypothetical protein [Nostoc sp. GT001]|nr:hypothetical protein [Nostoc sp. GT001]MDM9582981.1 hypothetical protein [Nostoc sp. GT001]
MKVLSELPNKVANTPTITEPGYPGSISPVESSQGYLVNTKE